VCRGPAARPRCVGGSHGGDGRANRLFARPLASPAHRGRPPLALPYQPGQGRGQRGGFPVFLNAVKNLASPALGLGDKRGALSSYQGQVRVWAASRGYCRVSSRGSGLAHAPSGRVPWHSRANRHPGPHPAPRRAGHGFGSRSLAPATQPAASADRPRPSLVEHGWRRTRRVPGRPSGRKHKGYLGRALRTRAARGEARWRGGQMLRFAGCFASLSMTGRGRRPPRHARTKLAYSLSWSTTRRPRRRRRTTGASTRTGGAGELRGRERGARRLYGRDGHPDGRRAGEPGTYTIRPRAARPLRQGASRPAPRRPDPPTSPLPTPRRGGGRWYTCASAPVAGRRCAMTRERTPVVVV
jgi:hypothetical protein